MFRRSCSFPTTALQSAVTPPRRPFSYCFVLPFDCSNSLFFLEGSFLEALAVSTMNIGYYFSLLLSRDVWMAFQAGHGLNHSSSHGLSSCGNLPQLVCFIYLLANSETCVSHVTFAQSEIREYQRAQTPPRVTIGEFTDR